MKIVVDLTVLELPATGIAKVIQGLYDALAAADSGLEVLGIHRRRLLSAVPPDIHHRRVARFLPPSVWRSRIFARTARRNTPAIIHFPWNGKVPQLPAKIPVATTLHDVLPLLIPGYFASERDERNYRRNRQNDIDRTHLLMTDSEFSRQQILKHFRLHREPIVITCATRIGTVPLPEKRDGAPFFLYVGGLDPRKSVDLLLRVYFRLRADGGTRTPLVITGSRRHAPPQLQLLLNEGIQKGWVEYLGYVNEPTLARLYTEAIALVYPSRYEGFGMPPLEAMSLGCPVIACRSTSVPEVCGTWRATSARPSPRWRLRICLSPRRAMWHFFTRQRR